MRKPVLLTVSIFLLAIGSCGGPLIMRLYFINGGKSKLLPAWLQSCGWPIILIKLIISYVFRRRTEGHNTKRVFMKVPMFIATVFIGFLVALSNYLYAIGVDYLPVSMVTLIQSTQLAFTAIFAFLIVKHKFTMFSLAAVIFLVTGAASLTIDAGSDEPQGETTTKYILGFIMTIVSSSCTGLMLPLIEFASMKVQQDINYILVMEMQMMITFSATILLTIPMLIKNVFKEIPREARAFELGEAKYYLVIVSTAIAFQFTYLGNVGVVFSGSALLAGIMAAVLLPVTEVLAVIFLHENFTAWKGVALGLCLIGFASYYYGETRQSKKSNLTNEDDLQTLLNDNALTT